MSKAASMKKAEPEYNSKQKKSSESGVMSWVIFIIFLIGIIILFRYVIQFTVVSGDSMNPTLEDNNILLTSSLFYEVERHDVIIYRDSNGFNVIKRVIGMPNETIEIREGTVWVDGTPLEEDYTTGASDDMSEVTISEGSYFVIGDNRQPGASFDSRDNDVGQITENRIKGKVVFSVFPPGTIK
jgi:signal peptidase I